MFKVMVPIEKKDGGTFWMRVGTGFPSKDGSGALNLYLDVMPMANKDKAMLHVREMDEEDFQRSAARADRRTDSSSNNNSNPQPVNDLPF
jgi:hypothetical protein